MQKGAMFMPGPARGPGMGRRGGPGGPMGGRSRPGMGPRPGSPVPPPPPPRRFGGFYRRPYPRGGGLGCMTMLMIPAVLLVAILVLLLL